MTTYGGFAHEKYPENDPVKPIFDEGQEVRISATDTKGIVRIIHRKAGNLSPSYLVEIGKGKNQRHDWYREENLRSVNHGPNREMSVNARESMEAPPMREDLGPQPAYVKDKVEDLTKRGWEASDIQIWLDDHYKLDISLSAIEEYQEELKSQNGPNKEMSHAARELALYAENTEQLYRSSWEPIVKNLDKKRAKGIYKSEMALILMKHHADRAAIAYNQEFGSGDMKWYEMFSVADRKEAAEHFLRDYETEAEIHREVKNR